MPPHRPSSLPAPRHTRNGVPIYCEKSSSDYRQDPYERYDPMVLRQSRLHLASIGEGPYYMQAVLDFVLDHLKDTKMQEVCEVGCGVGRQIAEISTEYAAANCYGVDYSYQMVRQARRYWLEEAAIEIDDQDKGYPYTVLASRPPLDRLSLLMAEAGSLPFPDSSLDVVFSSFLLDRLADPVTALLEWRRVLRPAGRLLITTPLNWQARELWQKIPDGQALATLLQELGFAIRHQEYMTVAELIDGRGNHLQWQTVCIAAECR